MKYIKTYELFDFMWKKPLVRDREELKSIVEESLFDISDLGFETEIDVTDTSTRNGEGARLDVKSKIQIKITKPTGGGYHGDPTRIDQNLDRNNFMLSEAKPTIEVALKYLESEYGFKLDEISFRESKWTTKKKTWYRSTTRGTKKLHKYSKMKYIKGDYEIWYLDITLVYG